jgi:hypothetical protein
VNFHNFTCSLNAFNDVGAGQKEKKL